MGRKKFNTMVILGATAGGKTALAVQAARRYDAEIISADSRQVYRGMDLGSGKDLAEYAEVPYHLIDIAEPGTEYNLFQFQRDCFAALEAIWSRGKLPLICGGTGMYLDAVVRGYRLTEVPENPELRKALETQTDAALQRKLLELKPRQHNRTNLEQRERLIRAIEIAVGEQQDGEQEPPLPPLKPLVFGLKWPRQLLKQRIQQRLRQRIEEGMIDEVEQLQQAGLSWEQLEFYGLEYRLVAQYLQQRLSRNEMLDQLNRAIGKFAKKQETFFRRMERQGVTIHWLDGPGDAFGQLCEVADGG